MVLQRYFPPLAFLAAEDWARSLKPLVAELESGLRSAALWTLAAASDVILVLPEFCVEPCWACLLDSAVGCLGILKVKRIGRQDDERQVKRRLRLFIPPKKKKNLSLRFTCLSS